MKNYVLIVLCIFGIYNSSFANNIVVSNISIVGGNSTFAEVKFNIQWENSWRMTSAAPFNYDAAWIFIKYKVKGDSMYRHATLDTSGTVAASGSIIKVCPDRVGAMVFRSADGSGTFTGNNMQVRWLYSVDNLASLNSVQLSVLAIEMVFVPQGAFKLGDGGDSTVNFNESIFCRGNDTLPFIVKSEDSIICNQNDSNSLRTHCYNSNLGCLNSVRPSFPKGFNGFYCMKYEITTGQHADFLNMINPTAATANFVDTSTISSFLNKRMTLIKTGSVYSTTTPHRQAASMKESTSIAYLAWSGLRPMTEMEYEKVCRGTENPVKNEYAWGNTTKNNVSSFTLINDGTNNEKDSSSTNINQSIPSLRVGSFANSTSSRQKAGATYYGAMDMSGGKGELVVCINDNNFIGTHGAGILSSTGTQQVWSNLICNGRGGSTSNNSSTFYQVSNRANQGGNPSNFYSASSTKIFRGVRTTF